MPLFIGWLLQKQLRSSACQLQHVDCLFDRCRCSLVNVGDFAENRLLFAPPFGGMRIEVFCLNSAVEPIPVHSLDARLDLLVAGLELLDCLIPSGLLCPVGLENGIAQPCENRLRDNKIAEHAGEHSGERVLRRIRLRALAAVLGAVIVHVLAFLQLSYEEAPTVATVHEAGIGEIVLYPPGLGLGACVQQCLNLPPTLASHQWLMSTGVGGTVPVKISCIQSFPKYLMSGT